MKVMGRLLWAATMLLLLSHCGDDSTPAKTDVSTANKDGGTANKDAGTANKDGGLANHDQGAAADAKTSNLSCGEMGKCSDTCAAACPGGIAKLTCMIKCSTDCQAKGCAAAKAIYTPLYNCINSKCLLDCMGGPTAGCKTCVTSKCAAEEQACATQQC